MARSRFDPSRRRFLGVTAAGLLGAACGRGSPLGRGRSIVGLFDAPTYDVDFAALVGRGLDELGVGVWGRRVLLKPNLVEFRPGAPVNTDPRLVAGAAEAFLRAGAETVVVAEGPGHRRDTEYLTTATGLLDALRDDRVPFVDLNYDEVRWVDLATRHTGLGQLALPVEVLGADLVVSIPKLKTHHWAGMTCAMKNLFGVVPGAIYGWPKNILHTRGIASAILDITSTVRPALSIVDAVTIMEGDGPIMGTARHLGAVLLGTDLVATDATCARLIGLDPMKVEYLRRAHSDRRLGGDVEIRGEPVARYETAVALLPEFESVRSGPARAVARPAR